MVNPAIITLHHPDAQRSRAQQSVDQLSVLYNSTDTVRTALTQVHSLALQEDALAQLHAHALATLHQSSHQLLTRPTHHLPSEPSDTPTLSAPPAPAKRGGIVPQPRVPGAPAARKANDGGNSSDTVH